MHKFLNLLSLLIFTINLQANDNNHTTIAQAEKWLSTANEKGFLENKGQMMDNEGKPVPQVLFKTEAPDLNIWVTQNGLTIQTLHVRKEPIPETELSEFEKEEVKRTGKAKTKKYFDWERVDIELKNATIKKENILKENPLQGHDNYFYPTCPEGIYGVKEYEKITIKDIYPGIDWVLYRNKDKGFKYDFIVHPEADYQQIELIYKSKIPIKINEQGELEMFTIYGKVKENKPVSFYEEKEIATRFIQNHQKPISINEDQGYETSISLKLTSNFKLGTSNLIIDPQLTWATFYGGNSFDGPMSLDTDNNGNIFVTGYTISTNFPVQDTGTFFQGANSGVIDAFILKFDNSGNRLWATYYGGTNDEMGNSITVDKNGSVFVTGYTTSTDFPSQNTGSFFQGTNAGDADVYILKFDNSGNRLWATYYGGSSGEWGSSITTDNSGNVFISGHAESVNFPVKNAGTFFQGTFSGGSNDAFIMKFDNNGSRLWATYYGGSDFDAGYSITTDNSGNVFVTGYTTSNNFPVQNSGTFFQGVFSGNSDVFLLKFDNDGNRLWATYYGGNSTEYGYSIAIDNSGNLFVTGITQSTNFPIQNASTFFQNTSGGSSDSFIMKFDNAGNRLWATYYGGSGFEWQNTRDNLAITSCGKVYMSFSTNSTALPFQSPCDTGGYFDNTFNGGSTYYDIFLVLFSNTGNLLWSTYIGGDGNDFREVLTLDPNDNLLMAGEWANVINSASYPITIPSGLAYFDPTFNGNEDSFIAKFCSNLCICSPYLGCTIALPCVESGIDVQTACNTYTWINGITYSTSTTIPTFIIVGGSATGCDSIITLNLTINPTSTSTDVQTTCNSYVWIDGITYTANNNTATFTLTNSAGCDSVVTLDLTINNSTTSTDVQTSCNSLTWIDGNTYSTSTNTPTFVLTNSVGCDSIVTLNLTISTSTKTTQNFIECQGFSITIGTNTYNTTGIFTDVINGCDTMITNLTINDAPQFTLIKEDDNCGEHVGSVLVNVTSSIPPVTYIWNTGSSDSIISNLPAGTYTVTINDGSGCSNANTINVLDLKLDCESFIFIPSVFTPNGDGQNDEFLIQLKGLEFISLEIYNRWGTKFFESTQKNRGWDGRTGTDTQATDGTYFFIVSYKTTDDEIMTKKGTLTLLR